jgi:hypothetical protein
MVKVTGLDDALDSHLLLHIWCESTPPISPDLCIR